jgi:archaellum biogenesis protein FlaJ (TadC family)
VSEHLLQHAFTAVFAAAGLVNLVVFIKAFARGLWSDPYLLVLPPITLLAVSVCLVVPPIVTYQVVLVVVATVFSMTALAVGTEEKRSNPARVDVNALHADGSIDHSITPRGRGVIAVKVAAAASAVVVVAAAVSFTGFVAVAEVMYQRGLL